MSLPSTSWGLASNDAMIAAAPDGEPVQIADHAIEAIDRLPQQHRGKETIEGFLSALVSPCNAIETALFELIVNRRIDTAEGTQLDVIGAIVGQDRAGLGDDDYRRYISARIAANRSSGLVEEILLVMSLILNDDDAAIVWFSEYPAAYRVVVEGIAVNATLADILARFIYDATKAGVRSFVQTSADVQSEMFAFEGAHTVTDDVLSGGETSIPVNGSDGFPATGTIRIDAGLAVEEDFIYTLVDGSHFEGSTGVANAHALGASVTLVDATTGKGFGDDGYTGIGGKFDSVKEGY